MVLVLYLFWKKEVEVWLKCLQEKVTLKHACTFYVFIGACTDTNVIYQSVLEK